MKVKHASLETLLKDVIPPKGRLVIERTGDNIVVGGLGTAETFREALIEFQVHVFIMAERGGQAEVDYGLHQDIDWLDEIRERR